MNQLQHLALINSFSLLTANRRQVVKVPDEEGLPDGMCIDSEGMLWVALFNGDVINRYNPKTGDYQYQYWKLNRGAGPGLLEIFQNNLNASRSSR